MEIKTLNDTDQFKSPLTTTYSFTDATNIEYKIKAERFGKKSFIRFVRSFPGGYTELFEQMAVIKDLKTGEVGVGMMEHLRTFKKE